MPPRRYRPRRGPRPQRKRIGGAAAAIAEAQAAAARPTGPVELTNPVVIKELAEKLAVSHAEIINVLIRNGIFATVNQSIDFDTASLVAGELGYETVEAGAAERAAAAEAAEQELVKPGSGDEASRPALWTADAGPDRDRHGPRRPRQDQPARRDPRDEGGLG
jgi:hypothetical protein